MTQPDPILSASFLVLETISLRSNNMDGSIQSNIANLSTLRTLSIGENELTGNIPVEISNMFALGEFFY